MRALPIAALLSAAAFAQPNLPGTQPLVPSGDPAAQMVDAIRAYLDREAVRAREARAGRMPDRDTLRRIIGAVDARVPNPAPHLDEMSGGPLYRVYRARWPVFDDVDGEGLLLRPVGAVKARVVAIPDADMT